MKSSSFNLSRTLLLLCSIIQSTVSANGNSGPGFRIVNGQVFTPGLAILDSPQPFTPLGGDTLQVAIDISGDGELPLSSSTSTSTSPTLLHNITIFLTSYTTIHNFTISNGSTPLNNPSDFVGPVLSLEPGSTVKHVTWIWPACLIGNGDPSSRSDDDNAGIGTGRGSARGEYNVSIHQSFRLNGTEFYTVFDLPISVTNEIPEKSNGGGERVECPFLENVLLPPEEIERGTDALPAQPFLGGGVSISGTGTGPSSGESDGEGEGGGSYGTDAGSGRSGGGIWEGYMEYGYDAAGRSGYMFYAIGWHMIACTR
ncbi:conserved hypothetical protein [Paecilomyces variotii No. 5]|uniref:Uncharacterized protein n=1 Tax=Byssochlamys spectabilis (strain No. 5 / NBRC 109023) TaxID=1356009 RepID=V5FQZ6_BYSSN|nr:conserved hypothetical protein [Paecilomyces variotii No. 5]